MNRLQTLMAMAVAGTGAAALAQERPNVILLIADDLGYGDLECYGAKNVETPNANRVANEGIRFTQAHCTAAMSTPSRYSILTGEYAWRKPGTAVLPGNAAMIIDDDQYTIADMFHDAGYATAAIGKWHLGLGRTTGQQNWNGTLDLTPRHIGFDYHYIQAATADRVPCVYLEQDTIANFDPSAPISVSYSSNFEGEPTGQENPELLVLQSTHGHNQAIVNGIGRIGYMKGGGKALWKDENIADSIAAHSRRFIMEHKDEPFFMYLCTNDVHVPRWPHERFRGKNAMGLRGDAIASFDWTIGEVLKALEDAGVADNTLLIITSDNGPICDDGYDDQAFEKLNGHKPTANRRGDKYTNYEGGVSVPLLVRWPAGIKHQEEENPTLLSLIDLFGSMGALIGAELPAGAASDSGDMLAQLKGESMEHRPWVTQLGEHFTLCVRTPEWKFIPATQYSGTLGWPAKGWDGETVNTGDRTVPQLYDMVNDPYETTNVAESNVEALKQMEEIWKTVAEISYEEPLMSTPGQEHWYVISTPLRENRCLSVSDGSVTGAMGGERSLARSQWKFEARQDGTVNFINRETGEYLDPTSAPNTSSKIAVSATEPSRGWIFDYAMTNGLVVIYSPGGDSPVQINQKATGTNYDVVNWGGGRHDDNGCQFLLTEYIGEPAPEVKIPTAGFEPSAEAAQEEPLYVVFRSSRLTRGYVCDTGDGVYGLQTKIMTPENTWQLSYREDGTVDFINRHTGNYILPDATYNTMVRTGSTAPENGWSLTRVSKNVFTITCGEAQLNQTTSALGYKIYNWGGGSETTDDGCRFRFTNVTELVKENSAISEVTGRPADDSTLYDLHGRAVTNPRHGIYIRSNGKKVIL